MKPIVCLFMLLKSRENLLQWLIQFFICMKSFNKLPKEIKGELRLETFKQVKTEETPNQTELVKHVCNVKIRTVSSRIFC